MKLGIGCPPLFSLYLLHSSLLLRDQSNIVDLVVQRALRELGRTPLNERKHLIGIDSHVDKLLRLLHIGSDDVRFVGICGMGGLGKTTIAEVVYNRIFRSFDGSSFLTDIREEASQGKKGLVSLQKQLLRDIFKRDYDISIVSKGSKLIAERLHGENILLILDDVDDHEQLDALAGGCNWFGQGSKVIITTRDVHILNVHKEKVGKDIQVYVLEELNFENSLRLFSLHAFSKNEPPEIYKQLSHEVVRCAEGLPLTLEVLGSFLINKTEEEWEDTLKRLKDNLDDNVFGKSIKNYDEKVLGKLMISYNKLGDPEKTIFLDIAYHFCGWEKEAAMSVWEACNLCPKLAIKELVQKHLLKIDADERLRMHDQLRDMGRRIVLRDCNGDPTKRSRLWSQDEILKVLKKDMGTQIVEGIILYQNFEFEGKDALSCEDFKKMPNLRFLHLNYNNLNGDFSGLPSRLRWFHWGSSHLEIVPANFYHEELVHLELSGSCVTLIRNDAPQSKDLRFQKLKVLNLYGCVELSLSPDFSWFPCLQKLDLRFYNSLLELSDSICQIASLKSLCVAYCESFKKLPTSIGDLKHLVKLCVRQTKIEELPDWVGQLKKLEELDISGCEKLLKLPTSMSRMTSLHHLDLRDTMVANLPDDFSKLSSLEVLSMGMPSRISKLDQRRYMRLQPVPFSMSGCSQLLELYLEGYMSLKSLPELPLTLTSLEVKFCNSLLKIPDLSNLKRLKVLALGACEGLRYLAKLPSNLIHLSCYYCKSLTKLPDLSNLKSLRQLDITKCENLKEIHGLEGTESLEDLKMLDCHRLSKFSNLSKLKSLRKLDITNCENLQDIQGLEGLESVDKLKVFGCHKLTEIPDLSKLKRLRELEITDCKNLEEIHGLEGTESLEEVKVSGPHKLTELRDLSKLRKLRKLVIANYENIEQIQGLEGIESLEELDAGGCYKLTGTRRKIHGQGGLVNNVGEGQRSKSIGGDEIFDQLPILCVVFAFTPWFLKSLKAATRVTIIFDIEALIRWGVKKTLCRYSVRTDDIELTPRDVIYMHHLNGFPFGSKDAIEILTVERPESWPYFHHGVEVKFWKVLFENKECEQQMPSQQASAMLVADFFRWSDADEEDDDEDDEDYVESDEEEEDDEDSQQRLDQQSHFQEKGKIFLSDNNPEEEEEEERNHPTVDSSFSCLGFDSDPESVGEEEEMLRANKRARIHHNDDGALGPSLSLTSASCEVELNERFNLQQMLRQQPNIDDKVQGFPSDIEESDMNDRTMDFIRTCSYAGLRGSNNVPEELENRSEEIIYSNCLVEMKCSHPLVKKALLRAGDSAHQNEDEAGWSIPSRVEEAELRAIERLLLDKDEVISSHRVEEAFLRATTKPLVDEDNEASCPTIVDDDEALLRAIGRIVLENEEEDGVLEAMERLRLEKDDNETC